MERWEGQVPSHSSRQPVAVAGAVIQITRPLEGRAVVVPLAAVAHGIPQPQARQPSLVALLGSLEEMAHPLGQTTAAAVVVALDRSEPLGLPLWEAREVPASTAIFPY